MKTEIRIDVVPVFSISKSTADFFLEMIENYCNETGAKIEFTWHNDGTHTYRLIHKEKTK